MKLALLVAVMHDGVTYGPKEPAGPVVDLPEALARKLVARGDARVIEDEAAQEPGTDQTEPPAASDLQPQADAGTQAVAAADQTEPPAAADLQPQADAGTQAVAAADQTEPPAAADLQPQADAGTQAVAATDQARQAPARRARRPQQP